MECRLGVCAGGAVLALWHAGLWTQTLCKQARKAWPPPVLFWAAGPVLGWGLGLSRWHGLSRWPIKVAYQGGMASGSYFSSFQAAV